MATTIFPNALKSHILRQINEAVDFSVIHDWVAPLYTDKTSHPADDPERFLH
ncbi:Mobile element protein [Geobacillus proteiniphilus]|uniref:Mobile element protein n=1 Tax=Geobacillus proteiniphilus TaxID=860353 RepID=A0A1Q5T3J7_9BACL|nr:Mobile element protein [Geobacillus proteiniphilus]